MTRPSSRPLAASAAAFVLAGPLAASADVATATYHPPTFKVRGQTTVPVAGPGLVVVKVLVNKDGTFKVQNVVRSTNPGDNDAALDIAAKSTYRPARRGDVAVVGFYDFTLRFTATGEAADSGTPTAIAPFARMIRANNFSGAQAGLKRYLESHPNDTAAYALLGVADGFLNQPEDATAAFDKAGTIPDKYKAVAAKAYAEAGTAAYRKKDYATAVTLSKHAADLNGGAFAYNALGAAEDAAGQHDAAIADLEKARSLAATTAGVKASDRAQIDVNLVSAYLDADKPDAAKPIADEVKTLDPAQTNAQGFFANYYAKSANAAATAGKYDEAGASYERAAAITPQDPASFYGSAALSYLQAKPPSNDKAKAAAGRALAADPENAQANFAMGILLANDRDKTKDALVYLNKADAKAKTGNDPGLTAAIEKVIKQLTPAKE